MERKNRRYGIRQVLMYASVLAAALTAGCSKEEAPYEREPTLPVTMEWANVDINQTEDLDWCLTRSNSMVAFTNYPEKTQYCLTWEGGLKPGLKENARLYAAVDGAVPTEYKVSRLDIESNGINTTLTFECENSTKGKIVYAIESGY